MHAALGTVMYLVRIWWRPLSMPYVRQAGKQADRETGRDRDKDSQTEFLAANVAQPGAQHTHDLEVPKINSRLRDNDVKYGHHH